MLNIASWSRGSLAFLVFFISVGALLVVGYLEFLLALRGG